MGLSTTAAADWLNKELGAEDYTPATSHDLCLYSIVPNSDGSGGTELTGNGYAPVEIANNTTSWPSVTGKTKTNGITISFPAPSGGDWLEVVAAVLKDHDTSEVRAVALLDPPFTSRLGQVGRSFGPGELTFRIV